MPLRPSVTSSIPAATVIALLVAVLALSTSVLMLRESRLAPGTLSCWRLLVAAIILSPWFVRGWIRHSGVDFRPAMLRHCVVPGLLLALHFTTWVVGARATEVANASLIVNMVPAVLPLLLWFLIREKIGRQEIVGTTIAFSGVVALSGADLTVSAATARGDLICFGSMLLLAAYLAFGRRNGRALPDVWLYVVPLYFIASAGSLGVAWITDQKIETPVGRELVLVTALAIGPTILGHALINYTLRHLPGQRVAVASQCQFIAAGMFELGFNGVLPTWGFYMAAPLVLIGAWVVINAKGLPGKSDTR
ncbi:MAG: DMT family transporter [Verrucomicrobiae bacterium]|nr:DMT family transporter [Verrucomicrobiae bacterium]